MNILNKQEDTKKVKKFISAALIVVMLLSLSFSAYAATATTAGDLTSQLDLISRNFSTLKQNDTPTAWYYAVTDLDHNGRLELLAATTTGDKQNDSKLKVWEVSVDGSRLESVKHEFSDAKSDEVKDAFPNIITDSADTIYDAASRMWYYIFTSTVETSHDLTPEESAEANGLKHVSMFMTATFGLSKHEDHIDRGVLGTKIITTSDDKQDTSIIDKDGKEMTEDQFLNIAYTTFAGKQRSNTSFDWFTANEANNSDRFVRSYNVFDNAALAPKDPITSAPAAAAALIVTKNPTNETHNAGESALFLANAVNYTSAAWSFVDPKGNAVSANEFVTRCGGSVSGENSTSLTVRNLNTNMNGWGVYCTFRAGNQSARTTTAYIYTRYDQNQLKNNQNLQNFYETWTYVYGTWICPFCGSEIWGDYCPYCGFDPDYYRTIVISDPVDVDWIYRNVDPNNLTDEEFLLVYGLTRAEYNALASIPDEVWINAANSYSGSGSFDVDWYCPVCGAGNNGSTCWSCGYRNGSEVIEIWDEPDVWDESYGGGWGSWDDWGYSGSGSWDDWDYSGGGSWDDLIDEALLYANGF